MTLKDPSDRFDHPMQLNNVAKLQLNAAKMQLN